MAEVERDEDEIQEQLDIAVNPMEDDAEDDEPSNTEGRALKPKRDV